MAKPDSYRAAELSIPRCDAKVLAESLKNGHINVASALAQINFFIREALKTIEDYVDEEAKMNIERKTKVDKMDKIISDLSERCQGMQQALLYKEEKYDEKCREVERYKVICELSARAAVSEGPYYQTGEQVYGCATGVSNSVVCQDIKPSLVKPETELIHTSKQEFSDAGQRNTREHTKLVQNQVCMSQHVDPLRPGTPRFSYDNNKIVDEFEREETQSVMSQYYLGGPCKRKIPINRPPSESPDSHIRHRMELIGGVNIKKPPTNYGPVALDRITDKNTSDAYDGESNKRVKINLTGQRNEVMSSSGNLAHHMKQRIVEKDLHKQVAGGCWTRLASRRKKDWPF